MGVDFVCTGQVHAEDKTLVRLADEGSGVDRRQDGEGVARGR